MKQIPLVIEVGAVHGVSDHKVIVNKNDKQPNYLQYKLDSDVFYPSSDNSFLKFRSDKFASATHKHTLSDIEDFDDSAYVHTTGDETISGYKVFKNDVTIQGNLTVSGKVTQVESENLAIKDNEIVLNDGETGDGISLGEAGISIDRGSSPSAKLIFDETDDKWKVGIKPNLENIATESWVSENFASVIHKHTLSDIKDFPALTHNAGKVLAVKEDESGVKWISISSTDEKVKADENDDQPGYLIDKIDNNTIIADTNNHIIKVNESKFAPFKHSHKWEEVNKNGSKLSDIEDVPSYAGNANKVLSVNDTEDALVWTDKVDEKVKVTEDDKQAGYLSDKIDNDTLVVDTTKYVIKVADNKFALKDHTHNIDSLENVDSSNKQKNTVLLFNGSNYEYVYYNPNLPIITRDFLASLDNISKSYAIFIAFETGLSNYIIYIPNSDQPMVEDRLIRIEPKQEKVYSVDITNLRGLQPTQIAFDIVMNPNLKLQYSFDGTTYHDYTPLTTISATSKILYVRIINDSTETKFTYSIVIATN